MAREPNPAPPGGILVGGAAGTGVAAQRISSIRKGASMKRAVLTLGWAVGLAAPAAAQWLGVPVWNSPEGPGLTISADYAKPNTDYGSGNTWGVRVSWGRGTTHLHRRCRELEAWGDGRELDVHRWERGV